MAEGARHARQSSSAGLCNICLARGCAGGLLPLEAWWRAPDDAATWAARRPVPLGHAGRARRCPATVLAREVLAQMTLDEKLHFLILVPAPHLENTNRAIPRLCIPALSLQDGPDGVAYYASGVTQLPAPLAVAATFDTGLAKAYGRVEGAEARTKGLDVLQGPELNLDRVPTSGRAFEAFGEDPLLTGEIGTAVAQGIQSQDVMAQVKHFTLYNQETARVVLDQQVSERALEELYFRPFQMAISGADAASVMCQFGSVNGTNACQEPSLFKELASWGFNGFVRSDFASVTDPVAAFEAGLSLLKPGSYPQLRLDAASGRLSMRAVDASVEAVLAQMFRFGLITHPRPFTPDAVATSPAHSALALQVAERSIVLLKNRGNLLPLKAAPTATGAASLAIVGVGAGVGATTSGYGSSYVRRSSMIAPLDAIRTRLPAGTVMRVAEVNSAGGPAAIPKSAIVPRLAAAVRPGPGGRIR